MAGVVVAHFDVVILEGGSSDIQRQQIDIHGSEQFFVGRNPSHCRYVWSDRNISNRHLRIHCVLYEQDRIYDTPPFVYATDVSSNGTRIKKSNTACASFHGDGVIMGKDNGAFLLDDGDELRISDAVTLIYRSHIPAKATQLSPIQQREHKLFNSRYLITDRLLGIGGYGKVVVAVHQKNQHQLACKVINLKPHDSRSSTPHFELSGSRQLDPSRWSPGLKKCFREFDILSDISHPNIIALEKVYWSSRNIYIFEELVTGGDLFSYLEYKGGRLCDVEAAVIIRQILKGVEYLHDQDIVHRDLKPDNILMTSLDDGARIVITDFGNARYLPKGRSTPIHEILHKQRMFSYAGTLEFAAPEIHKKNPLIPEIQGYSKSVDMWSIGCLTALLLSGDVIFTNRADPRYENNPGAVILGLAADCNLEVLDNPYHPVWTRVGSRPKNFIKQLLRLEDDERLTATRGLSHPWFSDRQYATEFDALYERSIQDWQPRPKVFRLVESLMSLAADVAMNDISGETLTEELISRNSSPDMGDSPSYRAANSLSVPALPPQSRLPTITEDMEAGVYDYDTPIPSPIRLEPSNTVGQSFTTPRKTRNSRRDRGMSSAIDRSADADLIDWERSFFNSPSLDDPQSAVEETPPRDTSRSSRSTGNRNQTGENSNGNDQANPESNSNGTQSFARGLSKRRLRGDPWHGFVLR